MQPLSNLLEFMTVWWQRQKKSCLFSRNIHVWWFNATFMQILPAVLVSAQLFVLSFFPLCFSLWYPSLSLLFSAPPCHHLGKNPFTGPETLNWLFIGTSCNWLLITVLHHVLKFKSAVSAQRKGPLQCFAVIHGCYKRSISVLMACLTSFTC